MDDLKQDMTVKVLNVNDFFYTYPVSIPNYQRSYVWNEEKTRDLLEDLKDFFENNKNDNLSYYLGCILLHQKAECYEIIDGQQRITTLLILDYVLKKNDSVLKNRQIDLVFNSPVSSRNIQLNRAVIERESKNLCDREDLFNRIVFSVVVTHSEDEAFTFFDSQNNRGVNLNAVDFLKAYHLRAIDNVIFNGDQKNEKEALQRKFATYWDYHNTDQKLIPLFSKILWRGRRWRGKEIRFECQEYILNEFQSNTINNRKDVIKLYGCKNNQLANNMSFSSDCGAILHTCPQALHSGPIKYPFSIRQPIEKGIGFFLYSEKYIELNNFLFESTSENKEINKVQEFYCKVYKEQIMSAYFSVFFRLCIISYYDRFESEKLFAFALWLDYLLGSYRINQSSIVKQTPLRIVRDQSLNLLDVINYSYIPEEIFVFIKKITNSDFYNDQDIISGKGVRGIYKKNIIDFFTAKSVNTSTGDLRNKKSWLEILIHLKEA